MHRRLTTRIALTALAVVSTADAHAFCVRWEDPVLGIGWDCADAGHDHVTQQLDFLAPGVLDVMVDNNVREDEGENADAPNKHRHVDECRFEEWTGYMNGRYGEALAALDPNDPHPIDAAASFGRLLHGIQDFYAHSNWVEIMEDIHGEGQYFNEAYLLDRGTGTWPALSGGDLVQDGAVVVGALPSDPWAPRMPFAFADYETVPWFTTPEGLARRGLVTGWNEGTPCYDLRPGTILDDYSMGFGVPAVPQPRDRNLVHGNGRGFFSDQTFNRPCDDDTPTSVCLNKDDPERPYYYEAELLATLQTEQEWCRLLSLSSSSDYGFQASTQLLTLFGHTDAPHPQYGATCSPVADGPVELKVTVRSVDLHAFAVAPSTTYAVALYNPTFTRIDRSSSTEALVPPPPPEPVRLCLAPGETAVVGLWGSQGDEVYDTPGFDADDIVLRGATLTLAAADGTFDAAGADLDFTVDVEVDPDDTDQDGDGLSSCAESWYGTSPDAWDTDGDSLSDGYEVQIGTDPTNQDTDGDFLGDAENWTHGTDPSNPDTDGDGIVDGEEVWDGTDPTNPDTDGDGLDDGSEQAWGFDPLNPDTDGDGIPDGSESCCNGLDETGYDDDGSFDWLEPDREDDGVQYGFDFSWTALDDLFPRTATRPVASRPSLTRR